MRLPKLGRKAAAFVGVLAVSATVTVMVTVFGVGSSANYGPYTGCSVKYHYHVANGGGDRWYSSRTSDPSLIYQGATCGATHTFA